LRREALCRHLKHNTHMLSTLHTPHVASPCQTDSKHTKQALECGASQYRHSSARTSAHLIASRTTELRRATRSAARLSRHVGSHRSSVGSTVSCGEWEERKKREVGENVGILVLWAVYAARGRSCPRLADQFDSLNFPLPSNNRKISCYF
jgi:hypothetical protein